MLRFLWIVQHSSSFFGSTRSLGMVHLYSSSYIVRLHSSFYIVHPHKADTTKTCELFYFRLLFAGAKTPLQRCRWLIKAPPPFRPICKQIRPLQRLLTGCKVHAAAFVSVVSRWLTRSLFNTC